MFSHWPSREVRAGECDTQDKTGRTKAGRSETAQLGEEKAEGDLTVVYNYLAERQSGARLFSKLHSDRKKWKRHNRNIPATYQEKKNYQESSKTLA